MIALPMNWPMTWIGETLVASSLLIGLVLILRRPVARRLGPQAAYLLWALPVLRLLLPPIPGATIASVPLIEASSFPASAMQGIEATPILQQAASSASPINWAIALVILWLSVAAAHMIWHIVSYRRFISGAVGAQAPLQTVDGILVYAADVAGPAAGGIVRRRIFLPHDFADRFNVRERRLALAHEVAHHRRGDLIANWIALAVLSVHWFNPLAHIAYRAFRADQELACDATVLGAASAAERHAYASAVVKAAWRKSPVAACPMNSAGQLKMRLAMMKAGAWSLHRRLAGLAVVVVIAGTALGVTASRTAAALPGGAVVPSPVTEAVQGAPAALDRLIHLEGEPSETAAVDRESAPTAMEPAAVAHDEQVAAAPAPEPATVAEQPIQAATAGPVAAPDENVLPTPGVNQAPLPQGPGELAGRKQLVANRSVSSDALPPAAVLKASAAAARKQLALVPGVVTAVRDVRAVMVDGRFNAVEPGVAYVGFCGQIRVTGKSGWLPFFVSTTPSHAAGRAAKCAGTLSSEEYTGEFRAAVAPNYAAAASRGRGACSADQLSCLPARASSFMGPHPSSSEFEYGTGVIASPFKYPRP